MATKPGQPPPFAARKPKGKPVARPPARKKPSGAAKSGGATLKILGAWLRVGLYATLIGATLGTATTLGICYRGAVARIDEGLAGPVWSVPGHV